MLQNETDFFSLKKNYKMFLWANVLSEERWKGWTKKNWIVTIHKIKLRKKKLMNGDG